MPKAKKNFEYFRTIAGGQTTPKEGPSREGSRNREKESGDKVSAAPAKQLTVEEMEKKTISILDEFLHIQDIKVSNVFIYS